MLLMYGIIVFVIMKQRGKSSSTRKRQDRVLLWQALAITCTLEVSINSLSENILLLALEAIQPVDPINCRLYVVRLGLDNLQL